MAESEVRQRLAAVLAADVAGYSRLMGEDERATIAMLDAYRAVFRETVESRGGRVVDMAGDSVLAVFDSATGAVEAAVAVQADLGARNADLPEARRMQFRIGVNSGDIQEKTDGTIYGDGVNVAARLEALAAPSGVMISEAAYLQVHRIAALAFADAGTHTVKNIAEPVRAYRVVEGGAPVPWQSTRARNMIAAAVPIIALLCLAMWTYLTHGDTDVVDGSDAPLAENMLPPIPTGPAVAVLPFETIGGDDSGAIFAAGVAEDVLTRLSYFKDLRVIGSSASFAFHPESADMRDFGRKLGAEFVLAGNVRRADDKVRLNVQLIDTFDGSQVWAETYDRNLTTAVLFEMQDEIANGVARALGGAHGVIAVAGLQAVRGKAPTDLSSYDCLLIAYNYQHRVDAESHLAARTCLLDVTAREPNYADAFAWLGQMYVEEVWSGFNPRDEGPGALDAAFEALNRALDLDPENQKARHAIAFAHYLNKDYDQFRLESKKAIAINPNNIETLSEMAWITGYIGDWDLGMVLFDRAMSMPGEPPPWLHILSFNNSYRNRDYAAAADYARHTMELGHWGYPLLVAKAEAQKGDAEAARRALAHSRSIEPSLTEEMVHEMWSWLFPDQDHIAHLMEGYRKAVAFEAETASSRPIIAVLPFNNMSGEAEQDYFADGITEDIIARLAKFENLLVIGRNTTFQFKDKAVDIKQLGEELGAGYILEGSVRRGGDTVRVTAQLINTNNGTHLWADTYDRELKPSDLFAMQDDITRQIAATIGDPYGVITMTERSRGDAQAPAELQSYECAFRYYEYLRNIAEATHRTARDCLESVVEREPDYALGWTLLGDIYLEEVAFGLNVVPASSLERARAAIDEGLRHDPNNAGGHARRARALVFLGEPVAAELSIREALRISPDGVDTLGVASEVFSNLGLLEESLEAWEKARSLNPYYPPYMNWYVARYHLAKGNYVEAIYWLENNGMAEFFWTHGTIAGAHCLLGDIKRGKEAIDRALALNPDFADAYWPDVAFFNEGAAVNMWDSLADGLRTCGLDVPPKPADLS